MKNLIILFFISFASCDANGGSINGTWKIMEVKNIINVDKEDWNEFIDKCVGKSILIEINENIINFYLDGNCDQEGDFAKCKNASFESMSVEIIEDFDSLAGFPTIEFNSNKTTINRALWKGVGGNSQTKKTILYNTNCLVSWGEETLKVLWITNNRIAIYLYSYVLILERD
jgi:hypothetical protein